MSRTTYQGKVQLRKRIENDFLYDYYNKQLMEEETSLGSYHYNYIKALAYY